MDKIMSRFLGIYLLAVIIFGILGLIDSLLSIFRFTSSFFYTFIFLIVNTFFFFFNLFMLLHFIRNKIEKITCVLPIYHLSIYLLFFIVGVSLGMAGLFAAWITPLAIIGILTSLFELTFGFYLLRRFEFF